MADPITTTYQFKIIGVNETLYERYARLTKPPVQNGTIPGAKMSMNQFGLITISFDSALNFRDDLLDKINQFAEPIIITTSRPYIP